MHSAFLFSAQPGFGCVESVLFFCIAVDPFFPTHDLVIIAILKLLLDFFAGLPAAPEVKGIVNNKNRGGRCSCPIAFI